MGLFSTFSSGGGFSKSKTTTQTGDSETQLQNVILPTEDGAYNVVARIGAYYSDGSNEYSAVERFDKTFLKSSGSITSTTNHTDSETFNNISNSKFSTSDMDLKKTGSGNVELTGVSPASGQFTGSSYSLSIGSTFQTTVNPTNGDAGILYEDTGIDFYDFSTSTKTDVSSDTPDSLAVTTDSNGDAHAAWASSGSDLFYAKRVNGTWQSKETILSNTDVSAVAIDLDQNQVPHVSYRILINDGLGYANRVGGSWSDETIELNFDRDHTSIYVNSDTNIGIVSSKSSPDFKVAIGSFGSWTTESLYSGTVYTAYSIYYSTDLSEWQIAFSDSSDDLHFANGNLGSFSVNDTSLQCDSRGDPVIYYDQDKSYSVILYNSPSSDYDLQVANNNSGWSQIGEVEAFSDQMISNLDGSWASFATNSDDKIRTIDADNINKQFDINWKTGAQVLNA